MNESIISEIIPKFIKINGKTKKLDISRLPDDINRETGLPIDLANEISEEVFRKLVSIDKEIITLDYFRDLVKTELTKKDLIKYRNRYEEHTKLKNIKFKLDSEFINNYVGKQPEWGPLGYFTYKRTYARLVEGEDRTEEFWETVKRVVEGCYTIQKNHCKKLSLPWDEDKAQRSAEKMFIKIWEFKFSPPGRGLWMMGTDYIVRNGSMALNNCGFASTKDIDLKYTKPFEFVMDGLMLGVGVGFDTKGAGKIVIKKPEEGTYSFIIPDSRAGWIKSLRLMLEAYFFGNQVPTYDFSKVRPAGAPIRGFGGIASGPGPLENMLKEINDILKTRIDQPIKSVDIVDIMNHIGKCVVAGNVRRSAEIALGDPNDEEFVNCKSDKDKLLSHRWASNNTVILNRNFDGSDNLDYKNISEQIKNNGEPGVFWLSNAQKYSRMNEVADWKDKNATGLNPCGEQTLESFELCCLSETFPSRHHKLKEYLDTLKYAYLYAKSVTLINTHWEETNAVMLKNRRIGISQTGIIEAFAKHGRYNMLVWCKEGYRKLKELDEKYSDWLCVPKSIKLTSVKPSGTISLLPGVSPGIHYPHSKYYIRRIRIAKNSSLLHLFAKFGYKIEDDKYSIDTKIIEFLVKKEGNFKFKNNVSVWEQALNAADYQKYWADNQVSITITFKKEEADLIPDILECFQDKLKSVSFLPIEDHGYDQPPYEEITKEKYDELSKNIKQVDLSEYNEKASGVRFCDSDHCEL